MGKVKGKDTKLEIAFRRKLWGKGLRYRKNPTDRFGKPDLYSKKYRTAVFVDSCFWHGCLKHCKLPTANAVFWKQKIGRNRERDKEVDRHYKKIGWKTARVWEHEIKKDPDKAVEKILKILKRDS